MFIKSENFLELLKDNFCNLPELVVLEQGTKGP